MEAGLSHEAELFAEAIPGPPRQAVDEPRQFTRAVATVLRALRRKAGVSQAVVADSIGLSANHLVHLERGHHNPNLYLFVKLAEYYGADWAETLARVWVEFHRNRPCVDRNES